MTRQNNTHDTRRRNIAIFALVAPSALFMLSLFTLAIINLIFNPTFWMKGDTEPVYSTPFGITILNIFFLITGTIGFMSLLPGVITGILLLTRQKYQKTK
jgi:hypothetical protein